MGRQWAGILQAISALTNKSLKMQRQMTCYLKQTHLCIFIYVMILAQNAVMSHWTDLISAAHARCNSFPPLHGNPELGPLPGFDSSHKCSSGMHPSQFTGYYRILPFQRIRKRVELPHSYWSTEVTCTRVDPC